MDEWDVLKAHARAQCVTAKDRLWCEVALAAGEMLRRLPGASTINMKPPTVTERSAAEVGRDIRRMMEKLARAEAEAHAAKVRAVRRAAKAAKRSAREERKRMRRAECAFDSCGLGYLREVARDRAEAVAGGRECCLSDEHMAKRRQSVREAELRYAIACAEAGAVPGGRAQ